MHRIEVALRAIYVNYDAVDEGERLRIFGKDQGKNAREIFSTAADVGTGV